jgi:hypothetical protein
MSKTQDMREAFFAQVLPSQKTVQGLLALCGLLVLVDLAGCKGMPTLQEQEQLVRANNLVLEHVSTRAVVNVWGKPPHHHSEFTHFFVMPDRSMIPRSRVVAGEAPKGWDAGVHAGEGVFFAYPDRGWLLVFLEEQLVYKEELKAEQLHTLVKTWAYEDRFRTRLDGAPAP